MRTDAFRLAALALALAGYWAPWLTHPAAALRLNGYELSEWVMQLPGVRDGSLPVSRLLFLAPLACLALLCAAIAVQRGRPSPEAARARTGPRSGLLPDVPPWWGWALLALGALCALMLLPPWPYILSAYSDPEFQTQFFVALAALVGVPAVAYLPRELKPGLQMLLAALAGALAAWALLTVRPAASELLNAPWPVGLGWAAMLAGLGALALAGAGQLLGPRD